MKEYVFLYRSSLIKAYEKGEQHEWYESHGENTRCLNAMKKFSRGEYEEKLKDEKIIEDFILEFGLQRIIYVLAYQYHIIRDDFIDACGVDCSILADFRFSHADVGLYQDKNITNIKNLFYNFSFEFMEDFLLALTPYVEKVSDVLVDIKCDKQADFKGKVVVLNPMCLPKNYRFEERLFYYVEGGLGTKPNQDGDKVVMTQLYSGTSRTFHRKDILGIVDEKLLTPSMLAEKCKAVARVTLNEEVFNQATHIPEKVKKVTKLVKEANGVSLNVIKYEGDIIRYSVGSLTGNTALNLGGLTLYDDYKIAEYVMHLKLEELLIEEIRKEIEEMP